jgi:hypothetical protein
MRLFLAISLTAALLGCGSTDDPPTSAEPEVADPPSTAPAGDEEEVEDVEDVEDVEGEEEGDDVAAAPDVGAHEVVLVVVHDAPLLRSEERLLDVVTERMQMRRIDAIRRDATEEEATFARARFSGEGAGSSLPPSLAGVGTVVFVRIPPNRELARGQLATRGFGGAVAFRRGATEPYVELRIDDDAAWRGADEQLWPWLISMVRAERAS